MLEALKYSTEPEHLVNEARRYLRGLKGNLVQLKKQQEVKKAEREAQMAAAAFQQMPTQDWRYSHNGHGDGHATYAQPYFGYQAR